MKNKALTPAEINRRIMCEFARLRVMRERRKGKPEALAAIDKRLREIAAPKPDEEA